MTDDSTEAEASVDSFFDLMAGRAAPEQYTPMDQYRDFRALFMASEQGRRVLRRILEKAHVFRTSAVGAPIDPYAVMYAEGERSLALWLLRTINEEPRQDQPSMANRKKVNDV